MLFAFRKKLLHKKKIYVDVTENLIKRKKKYKIIMQQFYKDEHGTKYNVNGRHVVLEPSQREIEVANILGSIYGGKIKIIPKVNFPKRIKTPDYIIQKDRVDLKEIYGNGKNTFYDTIGKQKRQARNFVFDVTNSEINEKEAIRQIISIYNSKHRKWVKTVILIKNKAILKIYKRG